jgi:hypothetical protein
MATMSKANSNQQDKDTEVDDETIRKEMSSKSEDLNEKIESRRSS